MNRIALAVALLTALAGAGLLYMYVERFEEEKSGGPAIMVVTARQDIGLGTTLTGEMIATRALPRNYVEERRHIKEEDIEDILGVRVSLGVRAGESILWTDLSTTAQERRDLSGLVADNMRAMTIRADRTAGFGGLLRPGDRVDVILTASRSESGGETVTIPLLQNVMVLAVGQDTGDRESAREREMFQEVTVSVTVNQAQILTYSNQAGLLTLILRNPDNIEILEGLPEVTQGDILEQAKRIRLIRRVAAAPPPVTPMALQ